MHKLPNLLAKLPRGGLYPFNVRKIAAAAAATAVKPSNASKAANNNQNCMPEEDRCSDPNSRGLVLGVYANEDDRLDSGVLTPVGWKYNKVS